MLFEEKETRVDFRLPLLEGNCCKRRKTVSVDKLVWFITKFDVCILEFFLLY